MTTPIITREVWVYLSASPLLGLTLTLLAYQAGVWLFVRSGQRAWANPVLSAIVIVTGFLSLTRSIICSWLRRVPSSNSLACSTRSACA